MGNAKLTRPTVKWTEDVHVGNYGTARHYKYNDGIFHCMVCRTNLTYNNNNWFVISRQ